MATGSPDGYTSDYVDELIREAEAEIYATSDDSPSDGVATDRCVFEAPSVRSLSAQDGSMHPTLFAAYVDVQDSKLHGTVQGTHYIL